MALNILSAGAAKGLITGLAAEFERRTGQRFEGPFGAVGAMKERFDRDEPCDVIVLTAAMIASMAQAGQVDQATVADLGRVRTGVAVLQGALQPAIETAAQLRDAVAAASVIYYPDPQRATAGIHCMKVLTELGLTATHAARFRTYPNGATAMAEMAAAGDPTAIGITQVTEILYTPGVQLVGVLPTEFELATVYTAAVTTRAKDPVLASKLVQLISGADSAERRREGGFE
jgi:molybdate transport system substrate-binding protein